MARIAFYAPIKPPDHPIPSGDRLIARNLVKALGLAGFDVDLGSSFIAYSKREADEILEQRKSAALKESDVIISKMAASPPDLWLTYHPYCKAPDWIGPAVSKALGIPYITVEAARTGQGFENGGDRWAKWHREAQAGIRSADRHLVFKPSDREYLTELLGSDEKLFSLSPFIDVLVTSSREIELPRHWRPNVPVLITTGMMRPGKKVENFKILSEALRPLQSLLWNLVVIGGGPEQETVEVFFEGFNPARLHFTGGIRHEEVLAYMAAGDLFVWPGWKEPIGMVYLEAQAMGMPVAALDDMGVPLVVKHGLTGLLAPVDNVNAFSENLATLISHPALRQDFGNAAKNNVEESHSMGAAAKSLKEVLAPLVAKS